MDKLSTMVKELNVVKTELKVAKAKEKDLTEQVKAEVLATGLETKQLPEIGMQVTCKEVTRTEIDEDKLVKIITTLLNESTDKDLQEMLRSCLLVKTVIDEDKVQELIYKGFIDIEVIQPAVIEKTHTRLTIKEVR